MATAHGERVDAPRIAALAARTGRLGPAAWLMFGSQLFVPRWVLGAVAG